MRTALLALLYSMSSFLGWADAYAHQPHQDGYVCNKGQILDQYGTHNHHIVAAFFSDEYDLLITSNGFSHQLRQQLNQQTQFHRVDALFQTDHQSESWMEFIEPVGEISHYIFSGQNGPEEIRDVLTFRTVICHDAWKGIDVEFTSLLNEHGVWVPKINFILKHASDLGMIKLQYQGQDKILMGEDRNHFELQTSLGIITESIPFSFLFENERKKEVDIRYMLCEPHVIGFTASEVITHSKAPLIIDPIPSPTVNWSTYFGGASVEQGLKTVIDGMGGVFLGGITQSAGGIASAGAYQGTYGGSPFFDIFIAKFDINGNRLWSTYFGGTADEQLIDMVTDASGNLYFTGSSASTALATAGTHQTILGGNSDVILAKMSPVGGLIWSTYYGGTLNEMGRGITLNGSDIAICGQTASTNAIASAGAHQLALAGGSSDGFIASFNSTGGLNWGSYLGGTGVDVAYQIKINAASEYILLSSTNSSGLSTAGAFQTVIGGSNDALITKFGNAGNLVWSTYFGSNLSDNGYGLAIDLSGDLLITGQTNSTVGIATAGAYDTVLNGPSDSFILSLSSVGTRNWSTYLGGISQDIAYSIWTDGAGSIYIGGNTASNSGLVTAGATQTTFGGGSYDGFLSCFDISGTVNWITYFGGSSDDFIRSVVGDAVTHLFVGGFTSSANSIATPGAFQTALSSSGVYDGFLADYTLAMSLPVELISFDVHYASHVHQVECHWTISQGIQCHEYILEKSTDAIHWQLIKELDCSQASDGIHFFEVDQHPEKGLQYYRISQQEDNGEISSLVKSIHLENRDDWSIYPNPTSGFLNISIPDVITHIDVYNVMGELIFEQKFLGNTTGQLPLDLSAWPAAQYFVAVRSDHDERKVFMISVQ